jgi:Mce-associated membrane protein
MTSHERASVPDTAQLDDALAAAKDAELEAAAAQARAAAARARALTIRLRLKPELAVEGSESDTESADGQGGSGKSVEVTTDHDGAECGEREPADGELGDGECDRTDGADDGCAITEMVAVAAPAITPLSQRRRRRRPNWKASATTAAIVLTVALLAITGYMVWQDHRISLQRKRTGEFTAAARQGVLTLMSLDFTHGRDDVQRIIASSTGDFKKNFQATADDFVKSAQDAKAVSNATVNDAAVESMNDNSAVVLVAATTIVTNGSGAKDERRSWRLGVTMTRDGGQLKIAKVDFVP